MGYGGYSSNPGTRIGNATHEATVSGWIEGRDVNGSRMFSDRGTIYSYGYHFAMAKFFTGPAGERRALVTRRKYSVTTSGHLSQVRSALARSGIPYTLSDTMDTSPGARAREALQHARAAVAAVDAARASADLGRLHEAQALWACAEDHAQLAPAVPDELAELARVFADKVAAWEARAARIFGQGTAKAWAALFALEGVTGEFISAGAYMVPRSWSDGMERRLCAYWRASDGRYCRIIKERGGDYAGHKVTWLDRLPADLAKGV